MDIYGRNYGYNPYNNMYQAQPQTQPTQMQMRTNKIFVTSLQDALNRYADPNTVILYCHQDEQLEYEITTDNQGKKTYRTFEIRPYSAPVQTKEEKSDGISKEEFDGIKGRLEALEKEFSNKYKKEKSGGLE